MGGDFLHVGVLLQVGAGDVERNVRGVDHAVQQRQEVRHDVLDVVGDEHLVAVEVNLVALQVHLLLQLREVQDARQVEGEVHVEVNLEQRLLEVHRVERPVEVEVILVLEIGRGLEPDGVGVVDNAGLLDGHALDVAFLVFGALRVVDVLGLGAEDDRDRHELAVLLENAGDASVLTEFGSILSEVEHDVGAVELVLRAAEGLEVVFGDGAHLEVRGAIAGPLHGHGVLALAPGVDVHAVGDHEGAVEAESEVTDDGFLGVRLVGVLLLELLHELRGSGEGDLVDVLVDLFFGHADAGIPDGQGLGVGVEQDVDLRAIGVALNLSDPNQGLALLGGVHGVGHELSQEDLVVAVEELFDDRKDVFRLYVDLALLHDESMSCRAKVKSRAGRCQSKKSDDLTGGHRIFRVRLSARQSFTKRWAAPLSSRTV